LSSFDVLARLAKQAVDEERQKLHRINVAILETEKRIDELRAKARTEAGNGQDFMTIGATLPAYLQANKLRVQQAAHHLRQLEAAHADQLQKLQQQRIEWKRSEKLAERQRKRIADEIEAKERKEISELVTIKAGREPKRQL